MTERLAHSDYGLRTWVRSSLHIPCCQFEGVWIAVLLVVCAFPCSAAPAQETRSFSPSENLVLEAYLAYYGRPADPAGLRYWADRMDAEGGNLRSIIQAFGESEEFNVRYGQLTDEALVNGLYQQLFGRDAEPGGLAFYVNWLETGTATLQTIALNVMFGATNEDADTIDNRLKVSRYYLSRIEAFHDPAAVVPADQLSAMVTQVSFDPATIPPALRSADYLVATLPVYAAVFSVTTTTDTADGVCNSHCSLRDAIMAANASPGRDLVEVPAGLYALTLNGVSEEADAYKDLEIRDDLHLQGAGAELTIIDGGDWTRLIEVDPLNTGASALLRGITLRGGFHPFGGALSNRGRLILEDVVLEDNTGYNGGAILNLGVLWMSESLMQRNQAIPSNDTTGFGGGIWSGEDAVLTLASSTVSENHARYNGGGIYTAGQASIRESFVERNAAGGVGGGLFALGKLDVADSTIADNEANDGGGIGVHEGSTSVIRDCTIRENAATGIDLGGGGGVFNYLGVLEILRTLLVDNSAFGEGGGAIETNGTLGLRNSTVRGNEAQWHNATQLPDDTSPGLGGGLLIIAGSHVEVEQTLFTGNVAGVSGGAIYNDRDTLLTMADVDIDRNLAQTNYGGGINNEGNIDFASGTLTHNSSPVHGGALTTNIGQVRIQDVSIIGNTSGNAGAFGNYLGGRLELTRVQVRNNRALTGLGGAALNDSNSELVINHSDLAANEAKSSGGAIFNSGNATLTLNAVTLENNVSLDGNGGGLENQGSATLIGGTLRGNSSHTQGGGLMCNFGDLLIRDSYLTANRAENGGGLSNGSNCSSRVENTLFEGNVASIGFGGAILNDVGSVALVDSSLSGNSASYGGGFSNNNEDGMVELTRASITLNSAPDGGAFVNFGTVRIQDSTVTGACNNHATVIDAGGNGQLCVGN